MAVKKLSAPEETKSGTSYAELRAQIEALQAEAERIRQAEVASVIADIKAQIVQYGLTAADLGLAPKAPRSRSRADAARAPAFADGTGNTWGGRGKRPDWLRAALDEGRTLDEFRVK